MVEFETRCGNLILRELIEEFRWRMIIGEESVGQLEKSISNVNKTAFK
jgi:hypothetical protein